MKKFIFVLLISIVSHLTLFSQVVINEIQSSNTSTIADEDSTFADWIELYNSGSATVSLKNYGLSNDPAKLLKWQFPDISLNPNNYLLVFASGKDRKSIVNHYETAIYYNNIWKYFVGTSEPLASWKTTAFNDGAWSSGPGGIGFGDGDDNTTITNTVSFYMRKTFNLLDTTHIVEAILNMDFDDGFVAYINGVEIARCNVTGSPPTYLQGATTSMEAQIYQGGLPKTYIINKQLLRSILIPGNNVLAIQVHNTNIFSTDMSAIPWLTFGLDNNSTLLFGPPPSWIPVRKYNHTNFKLDISGETLLLSDSLGNIVNQKTFGYIAPDNSLARNPDGSSNWCISTTPSPEETNNGYSCNSGYISKPAFSLSPGFYPVPITLSISSLTPGAQIHFTRNGKLPTISDPLYTVPINIDTTSVIRARAFGVPGYLNSEINTGTFFIDETANLPVISISTDSSNLWDWNTGIYALGPGADVNFPYFGANFWQDWQKESHVEYFLPMGNRQFDLDAGLSINGAYSRAFAQKSFQIEAESYFNPTRINYQLFQEKPIDEFKSFNLRNSGNDWLNTMFRDDLMETSVKSTHVDYTAYQPVLVFLNTQYWGLYNMRERSNKDFMYYNHGVNPDSVDVIHNEGVVQQGTGNAFWGMYNYINTRDISIQANYDTVQSILDMENYADYFATEIYYDNGDWIGNWTNNIKLWKPQQAWGKWRYLLVDMDFGCGLYGLSYTDDRMYVSVYPPSGNVFSTMFGKIIQNAGFRNYFINRFADLINTIFVPKNLLQYTYSIRDRIASEMPRELLRYAGNPDISNWYYTNIGVVTDFIQNRPFYARNHIQNFFGMVKQVDVTLDVFPAGAGRIKISTIIPDSLPWQGIYFDGNPVMITAIPNPGYTFLYWEPNNHFPTNNTNQSVMLNISSDDVFRAHFNGNAQPLKLTVSEVNFHSDPTCDAGDWLELHNYGASSVDVSDWRITDSVIYHNFIFPMGSVIPANSYLVLAEDIALFHMQHPGIPVFQPLGFKLNNADGKIVLYDNINNRMLYMHYFDSIPWQKAADGYGRTLELINDSVDPNLPSSWFAGCVGGSPGGPYIPCTEQLIFSEINYNSSLTSDAGDWLELHNISNISLDISNWGLTVSLPSIFPRSRSARLCAGRPRKR